MGTEEWDGRLGNGWQKDGGVEFGFLRWVKNNSSNGEITRREFREHDWHLVSALPPTP
jgi:hypothetical protein